MINHYIKIVYDKKLLKAKIIKRWDKNLYSEQRNECIDFNNNAFFICIFFFVCVRLKTIIVISTKNTLVVDFDEGFLIKFDIIGNFWR